MIFDIAIFLTALIGSTVAALYDLKTTEVPNWVFYIIMAFGIPLVILKIFFGGSVDTLILSTVTGLGLFALGYGMYRTGQWGGADMVLLGLIGFMIPSINLVGTASVAFPVGLSFLVNLFVVGAIYMIIYAVIYALRERNVIKNFYVGIKNSSKIMLAASGAMGAVFGGVMVYSNSAVPGLFTVDEIFRFISIPIILTASLFVVYNFAKAVENFGFKKKIPVSKLRVGDMLLTEKKLVGITEAQVKKIKKSGKRTVWIKDGVRFIPAFPMALLFTLFAGDAIFLVKLLF